MGLSSAEIIDRILQVLIAIGTVFVLAYWLAGCSGEQLSTVQGDWRQLWHDPAMPTAVAEPPK